MANEANLTGASNRLPFLADAVACAIADMTVAAKKAAERAIDAGNHLIEAKSLCAHGEWLKWLRKTGLNERTAQRYMALASSGLQSDTVSVLGGVTPALRFLRLRSLAMQQFDEAEAACREGKTGDDELVAIETAMLLMEHMIAMFPPESVVGRG